MTICGEHMRSISYGTVGLFLVYRLHQTRWINEVAHLRAELTTHAQQLQLMQQRMEQLAEAARQIVLRGMREPAPSAWSKSQNRERRKLCNREAEKFLPETLHGRTCGHSLRGVLGRSRGVLVRASLRSCGQTVFF